MRVIELIELLSVCDMEDEVVTDGGMVIQSTYSDSEGVTVLSVMPDKVR
jgi:hypothetical protein